MTIKKEWLQNTIALLEKHKVTLLYAMQTPEFVKLVTGDLTEKDRDRMVKRMRRNMNGEL